MVDSAVDGRAFSKRPRITDSPPSDAQPVNDDILSEDSDAGSDIDEESHSGRTSKRRRRHNAILAAWLSERVGRISREESQTSEEVEKLSYRALLAKQDSTRIVDSPRDYQLELFEQAKKRNVIAVLDTGSGKTLIAVLLLRYMLDHELEDRAAAKPRRLAFFIVASVALAHQQANFLSVNLDHKVALFHGAMNVDLYTEDEWRKHFEENMVIVCTADVLYMCLSHSFISMDRINLMIFDEAHHTKKDHSYSRIVRDFYRDCDSAQQPKIFGMTASPVDTKVNVVKATKELEDALHCQIATAADLTLLQTVLHKAEEQVVIYPQLPAPYMTGLCTELDQKFGELEIFKGLLQGAKDAASELGEWCADHLWQMELAEKRSRRLDDKLKRQYSRAEQCAATPKLIDNEIELLRSVQAVIREHTFLLPGLQVNGISPKVLELKKILDQFYENPTKSKCIIFVTRRSTAKLLNEVFNHIGTPNLKHGLLIGAGGPGKEVGDASYTVSQQNETLYKFREGILNCVFATSVAEEGLDIKECNVVIRFDLYTTMIQYVQSRGRARHKHSKYIHMLEQGNALHTKSLKMVRENEAIMRQFCEALPKDRLLKGNEADLGHATKYIKGGRVYKEPSTGARLTYNLCLILLAHFVDCLPHEYGAQLQPTYVLTTENKHFICEVLLPEVSPIRSVLGRPEMRKSMAKRSAAFEACLVLRKHNHLDGNLMPIYHKQLPAMRNAHLALNKKDTAAYDMRLKPSFWAQSWGSIPTELYLMVMDLDDVNAVDRPHTPLALLSRKPLFIMPRFPIYPKAGAKTNVLCIPVEGPVFVTRERLAGLTAFTLRVFLDLFNKTFENNESAMSYWIAPLHANSRQLLSQSGNSSDRLIDWTAVDFVLMNEMVEWTIDTPHQDLANRFLVDKWNGGRRFFTESVIPELRQTDPVPTESAEDKHMNTILDYTVSLYARSRTRVNWLPNQPVILAHKMLHRRNWLDAWDEKEKATKSICYVVPEPLKHSALSTAVATMGYLFPALIWRVDSYLIAQEVCSLVGLRITTELALEAITKDSDNTDEHKKEQIQFQRGMGKNYERLEFIGDAFLKMGTSISLYAQNAGDDEFESHVKRMLMICNKNLYNTAMKLKLYEYIRSQSFSRRTWYPEKLKLLAGKGYKKTGEEVFKHHLNDKTIADVCEALIGASLLSYHDSGNMDMAVKAVTIFVASPDHDVENWDGYYKLYKIPDYQTGICSAAVLTLAAKVETEHAYHFTYPRLLRSAFMHPSYPFSWERIPSYQRLEFLGDALLDMVCVNFLFHRFPDRDPQWLTEHKMAMVSNKFLGALSVKLGFHKHLQCNTSVLLYQIAEYVTEITELEKESKGARDYWNTTIKQPPKALPDIVEAYIGAIFVDSAFNFTEVERFFTANIQWFFEDMTIYDTFANAHPTTYLGNLLAENFRCMDYRVMAGDIPGTTLDGQPPKIGCVVIIHDQVVAYAIGSSSRYGKVRASQKAVEDIEGLAPFEYRRKYGCNCRADDLQATEMAEMVGTAI